MAFGPRDSVTLKGTNTRIDTNRDCLDSFAYTDHFSSKQIDTSDRSIIFNRVSFVKISFGQMEVFEN